MTNDVAVDETNLSLNGVAVADNGDHTLNKVIYGPGIKIGITLGAAPRRC